jgi:dihydroneopterin aldolase
MTLRRSSLDRPYQYGAAEAKGRHGEANDDPELDLADMALFLASVADPREAEIAIAGGCDLVDFSVSAREGETALTPKLVRLSRAVVAGRRATSAFVCDQAMEPQGLARAVERMAETGVDHVRVALFDQPGRAAAIAALAELRLSCGLIGVLFADEDVDLHLLDTLASAGFVGAMLDTAQKTGGRLLTQRDPVFLEGFVDRCRERELVCGLAGSLEPPDVPRLLALRPDILGFDGPFRTGERKAGGAPISLIRALIPADPRGSAAGSLQEGGDPLRPATPGQAAEPACEAVGTNRIFVHDLIIPISIGAYRGEKGLPQRVRFNVDAFVRRARRAPADMRDVLSYDLITDGIARLVAAGHVDLVESLAERIAAMVLAEPRVAKVVVRVEKLDVGPAVVGVEIIREKADSVTVLRHPAVR